MRGSRCNSLSGRLYSCGYRAFADARCAKGRRDNHDLILHTNIYCMWYRMYTSELCRQLSQVDLSQSVLYYDRRSVGQSILVSSPHLGLMTRFFQCQTIAGFWYGAPSLTRERVCLLQCTIHFTVSDLRPGPCIYIPQGQGGPVIPPGTG
jgi:hypothetical protein